MCFYNVNDDLVMYKLSFLINKVTTVSQKILFSDEYFSIDESTIKFKGRNRERV